MMKVLWEVLWKVNSSSSFGNIASTDIIDMDQDDLKVLDAMAKDVIGDPYAESFMGGLIEGQ